MPNQQLIDLYLRLERSDRDPSNDRAMIDELAQIARDLQRGDQVSEPWKNEVSDCLFEIARRPSLLAVAISQWLTTNDDIPIANALLRQVNSTYFSSRQPWVFDLMGIEPDRALLAGYRLCARAVAPVLALSWVLSLAQQFQSDEHMTGAVEYVVRYYEAEFPSTTTELLSVEGSPFQELPLTQAALARLQEQDAILAALPKLREFAMTPEMRGLNASLKRREGREIDRLSREGSIFELLVTRHRLKYATRTAVEFQAGEGVQERTLTMSSHEFSMELPLSDVTDPIMAEVWRRHLWQGPRT